MEATEGGVCLAQEKLQAGLPQMIANATPRRRESGAASSVSLMPFSLGQGEFLSQKCLAVVPRREELTKGWPANLISLIQIFLSHCFRVFEEWGTLGNKGLVARWLWGLEGWGNGGILGFKMAFGTGL